MQDLHHVNDRGGQFRKDSGLNYKKGPSEGFACVGVGAGPRHLPWVLGALPSRYIVDCMRLGRRCTIKSNNTTGGGDSSGLDAN